MLEMQQSTLAGQLRWTVALRGVIALLFGIIALVWPAISLLVLVYLFGWYALIGGVLAVTASFQVRSRISSWWVLLLEGLVGIAIGLMTFFWPGITGLVLLLLVATWAVILGICEIAAAFASSAPAVERWLIGITGALSIVFGILLFTHPGAGLLTLAWLIGFYAIMWGITLIGYAMQRHEAVSRPQLGH